MMNATSSFDMLNNPEFADYPAVINGQKKLRYTDLAAEVDRVVETFKRFGISSEQRVVLMADNSYETLLSLLACWHLGAVAVPVNPKFPSARLDEMISL